MALSLPLVQANSLSFQGSALERTAFEAPPHVFVTQEAGASDALRSLAEPGNEFKLWLTRRLPYEIATMRIETTPIDNL